MKFLWSPYGAPVEFIMCSGGGVSDRKHQASCWSGFEQGCIPYILMQNSYKTIFSYVFWTLGCVWICKQNLCTHKRSNKSVNELKSCVYIVYIYIYIHMNISRNTSTEISNTVTGIEPSSLWVSRG